MHIWNLKNKINNNNKSGNKLTDTENILRDTRWEVDCGEEGKGIERCTWMVAE